MDNKLEHIVKFEQGYDCINFECVNGSSRCKPGSGGSHGKHGLNIKFVAKGKEGAVQFVIYTGWFPQKAEEKFGYVPIKSWGNGQPFPADLGYHSKTPRYGDQTAISDSCEYCDGGPCYYDGSGLNAHNAMYTLVNGGDAEIWKFLDRYYQYVFCGGEFPVKFEYPYKERKGGDMNER